MIDQYNKFGKNRFWSEVDFRTIKYKTLKWCKDHGLCLRWNKKDDLNQISKDTAVKNAFFVVGNQSKILKDDGFFGKLSTEEITEKFEILCMFQPCPESTSKFLNMCFENSLSFDSPIYDEIEFSSDQLVKGFEEAVNKNNINWFKLCALKIGADNFELWKDFLKLKVVANINELTFSEVKMQIISIIANRINNEMFFDSISISALLEIDENTQMILFLIKLWEFPFSDQILADFPNVAFFKVANALKYQDRSKCNWNLNLYDKLKYAPPHLAVDYKIRLPGLLAIYLADTEWENKQKFFSDTFLPNFLEHYSSETQTQLYKLPWWKENYTCLVHIAVDCGFTICERTILEFVGLDDVCKMWNLPKWRKMFLEFDLSDNTKELTHILKFYKRYYKRQNQTFVDLGFPQCLVDYIIAPYTIILPTKLNIIEKNLLNM